MTLFVDSEAFVYRVIRKVGHLLRRSSTAVFSKALGVARDDNGGYAGL